MERWQKMNVYFSLVGLIIFIVCIIFIKKLPILLLAAAFAVIYPADRHRFSSGSGCGG